MCSSAAWLRIRPALISDNVKLIRMRAEIAAEETLPNQKGKRPEGALRRAEGSAAACERSTGHNILCGHCNTFPMTAWPSLHTL